MSEGLFTHNEALAYLANGALPDNFRDRLENFIEFESCSNCDDVRCMHFRMRDWWSADFDECDGWCCPFCSDMKSRHYARPSAGLSPSKERTQ